MQPSWTVTQIHLNYKTVLWKSGQEATALRPHPSTPFALWGDRKSRHWGRRTSGGTAMPGDSADYSNGPNKHGPINHSGSLSQCAHKRRGTFVIVSCECRVVWDGERSCVGYMDACICISTCCGYGGYLCMHASGLGSKVSARISAFSGFQVQTFWMKEVLTITLFMKQRQI